MTINEPPQAAKRQRIIGHEVTPTAVQLFAFSAATGNPHRIHYDKHFATQVEGYCDVLVHGPLLGTWMLELIDRWSRPWGIVEEFSFRSLRPVTVLTRLIIDGSAEVTADGARFSTWIEREDGARVAEGAGRVIDVPPTSSRDTDIGV